MERINYINNFLFIFLHIKLTQFIYEYNVGKVGAKDINLTVENGDIFAIIMIVYVLISVLLVSLLFTKGVKMFRNLQE